MRRIAIETVRYERLFGYNSDSDWRTIFHIHGACFWSRGISMLFAYFGPETMAPVASIVAASIGVAMMFGRNILIMGRSFLRKLRPRERQR